MLIRAHTGVARPSGAHSQGTVSPPTPHPEPMGPSGPVDIVRPVHPLATLLYAHKVQARCPGLIWTVLGHMDSLSRTVSLQCLLVY